MLHLRRPDGWRANAGYRHRLVLAFIVSTPLAALGFGAATPVLAEDLKQPPRCSVYEPERAPQPADFCYVEPVDAGEQETPSTVNLSLTTTTSEVGIGGYRVVTDNYNGTYLPPIVELGAGDTLKVRLLNALAQRPDDEDHGDGGQHGAATNLHTHGWIVPPKNATNPAHGNGDNIFVDLQRGEWLDYNISIPVRLPASVLDGRTGEIAHPSGPFWYHSHRHGLSEGQVSGGMSGMMSVGPPDANVVARSGVDEHTRELRDRTKVSYLMLRDIELRSDWPPDMADGTKPATWVRPVRMRPTGENPCYPTDVDAPPAPPPELRQGYCLNPVDLLTPPGAGKEAAPKGETDRANIWLFTVNGQRFPTINIARGENRLLRIANLSANVTYILSLVPENDPQGTPLSFDLVSVDGVVPGTPGTLNDAAALSAAEAATGIPADSMKVSRLVLMPAARAEIYLRNDGGGGDEDEEVPNGSYVLRTAEQCTNTTPAESLLAGPCDEAALPEDSAFGDHWPEIQLARVTFLPPGAAPVATPAIPLGRNLPVAETGETPKPAAEAAAAATFSAAEAGGDEWPEGCIRDIDQQAREHRRVTFVDPGVNGKWRVSTHIVAPPTLDKTYPSEDIEPVDAVTHLERVSFEAFLHDGQVDWSASHGGLQHPCVRLANGDKDSNGHNQLWEIRNNSSELHNFHIHQMKFRLANGADLQRYGVDPSEATTPSSTPQLAAYLEQESEGGFTWHDTLPVPVGDEAVFIIMNFDAAAQLGKFVYHCHILEHEDDGLMVPMEVVR